MGKRSIILGNFEGFMAGCPFCTAKRKGVPDVGARFRILNGSDAGRTGVVLKVPEGPYPLDPYEIFAHMDGAPPNMQSRFDVDSVLIQILPAPSIPDWAPPLSLKDAAIFDEAVVNFCEKSFSFGKSVPKWSAFNELIRVVWQNRLPLEPSEVMSVLKAHGVPKRWEKCLSDFYEKGINLLVYVKGRKPIKNKRVEPLHSSLAESER